MITYNFCERYSNETTVNADLSGPEFSTLGISNTVSSGRTTEGSFLDGTLSLS